MKQRNSLLSPAITALLLCGAFATPLAFAQTHHKHKKTTTTESSQTTTSNDTGTNTSTDASTSTSADTSASGAMGDQSTSTAGTYNQAATPATPATPYPGTGTPATPATPANPSDAAAASMGAASPRTMSWSDLDTDHNGSLSKSEASSLSSLSQVFDAADSNKDGTLTADEYRAYLKTQGK